MMLSSVGARVNSTRYAAWRSATWLPAVVCLVVMMSSHPVAAAQPVEAIVGGADWTDAPEITTGDYLVALESGRDSWLRFSYRPGALLSVVVDPVQGSEVPAEVDLTVRLVDPDLNVVVADASQLNAQHVFRSGQPGDWFLQLRPSTPSRRGTTFEVILSIDTGRDADRQDCTMSPACALDDQLMAVAGELAAANVLLAGDAPPTLSTLQADIDAAQSHLDDLERSEVTARQELERATARIAELCAPESTCTVRPETGPTTGWAWLAALGLSLAMVVAMTFSRRRIL